MGLTHVKWSFIQVSWLVEKVVFLSIPNEYYQEFMSATKRREGASNYRTLFAPSSVESRALNLAENAPYKVSNMFAPTSLRSQQVAIITAGELLGTHTSHSSNLKAH